MFHESHQGGEIARHKENIVQKKAACTETPWGIYFQEAYECYYCIKILSSATK